MLLQLSLLVHRHAAAGAPFAEILSSGHPDFPFCLCWANDNCTRRWDGQDQEVLIAQHYSLADDEAHLLVLASNSRELL